MVKKIISLVLILFFLYVPTALAFNFNNFCSATGVTPYLEDPLRSPGSSSGLGAFEETLIKLLSWLFPISIIVAVLMLIIGAYYFVFSGGDPTKAARGRKVIIYALLGMSIVVLSLGIWNVIKMILGI